ncbi:hypothetical protein Tco_0891963 [Tanacetum coccineum]|uniref:Uncharacterized protein n=1 Tax=Tanacetum coccineum TaxID=301880 RepID=A0ABQ5C4H4_9ASTR
MVTCLRSMLLDRDSHDLDVANMERICLCLFQFSLRVQVSNWLECLPAGSISAWEDLTTRPQPAPRVSSTHVPQAYTEAISSNLHPRGLDEPPKQNSFAFGDRISPSPQPQALGTNFEARVRDYMEAHTERMERFENSILQQQEEINDRMGDMFRLLKELTMSRTLEKLLGREEVRHPVTTRVNAIFLIRIEEEKSTQDNAISDNGIVRPTDQILWYL